MHHIESMEDVKISYEPADMVGHAWLLQMGTPLVGSISWTILSMPPRTRYCSETSSVVSMAISTRPI
jgi:hypothetical protein